MLCLVSGCNLVASKASFISIRDRSKIRGGGRAGAFLCWPTSFEKTLPIPGAEKMLTPQNSLHNLS